LTESNGIVRTVSELRGWEKLSGLISLTIIGRAAGLVGRPFRLQPKRYLGHKVTKWRVDSTTGRPVIAGHVRV
jgi:hypothetical protein